MFLKFLQNSLVNVCVFLWNLRNFSEDLSYRTPLGDWIPEVFLAYLCISLLYFFFHSSSNHVSFFSCPLNIWPLFMSQLSIFWNKIRQNRAKSSIIVQKSIISAKNDFTVGQCFLLNVPFLLTLKVTTYLKNKN